MEIINKGHVEDVSLSEVVGSYYIDYAYETIRERAIPDVRDGLKPVHLRILYAMNELNLGPNAKTLKSARVVGDVLGKYHCHGDQSVYGALTYQSQEWNMRYPTIYIHGNNGSIDGDPSAAMRYTETRLTKYGAAMMRDIEKNTVDFVPNFDDTLTEPAILPSKIPNLLANGSNGIACGFATNIPPHNLNELYDAACLIIDEFLAGNELDLNDLTDKILPIIKGPDFPLGGVLTSTKEMPKILKTGKGKVTVRCKYEIVEGKRNKQIVITEIPYQVNKQKLVEKIDYMINEDKIDGIRDIKDFSKNDIKIVINLKRDADPLLVMNNLLNKTDLKKNFNYNLIGIQDKEIRQIGIIEALLDFISSSATVIKRRSQYELERLTKRMSMIDAILLILCNVDLAIQIIRHSTSPVEELMQQFNLTQEQAEYIYEMKIKTLSLQSQAKLEAEREELQLKIPELQSIIEDDVKTYEQTKKEFLELKAEFGDERRTTISLEGELTNEDLIKDESLVVTITSDGNIKSVLESEYNTQKRNGKGSKAAVTKDNEIITSLFTLNSKDDLLFITNYGNVHHIKAYKLPKVNKTSKGKNIVNFISLEDGETIVTTLATRLKDNEQCLTLVTDKGQIKRISLNMLSTKFAKTKVITLKEGHNIVDCILTAEEDNLLVATTKGQCVRYNSSKIRPQGRSAQGVIGIKLKKDDKVISLAKLEEGCEVVSITSCGIAKRTVEKEFPCATNKGGVGVRGHKLSDKTGNVVACLSVTDPESTLLLSSTGGNVVRIAVSELGSYKRDTAGFKLMNLGDFTIATASIAPKETVEEELELVKA